MLLFIQSAYSILDPTIGFNTSHVTLYRTVFTDSSTPLQGFNTSHVTLYLRIKAFSDKFNEGFNTSHVTLYQFRQIRNG